MLPVILNKGMKFVLNYDIKPQCKNVAKSLASTVEEGKIVYKQENQERDLVNFPRPERAEYPGQVRLGFIPDEWFTFFYKKTGVTGPYTLGVGTATFLVSKEFYVLEHNFFTGISMAIICTAAVKQLGPRVAAYTDKEIEVLERKLKDLRLDAIEIYEEAILDEKHEQWRATGQMLLFEAKRKTIAMALEAEYRQREMTAYHEVMQRLEWEVEQERVMRNLGQKHMALWVSQQVGQSLDSSNITERVLKQCIKQLHSIAPSNRNTSKSGGPGSTSAIPYSPRSGLWLSHLLLQCVFISPHPHYYLSLLLRQKARRVFPFTVLYI